MRKLDGRRIGAPMPEGAFIARNGWWFAECPKHGETQHLSVIGGRCVECQKESVEASK